MKKIVFIAQNDMKIFDRKIGAENLKEKSIREN